MNTMIQIIQTIRNNLKKAFPELNIAVGYDNFLDTMPDLVQLIEQNLDNITHFYWYAINKFITNERIGNESKNKKFVLVIKPTIYDDNELPYFWISTKQDEIAIDLAIDETIEASYYQSSFAFMDLFHSLIEQISVPISLYIKYGTLVLSNDTSYELKTYFAKESEYIEKQQILFDTLTLFGDLLTKYDFKIEFDAHLGAFISLMYDDFIEMRYEVYNIKPLKIMHALITKTIEEIEFDIDLLPYIVFYFEYSNDWYINIDYQLTLTPNAFDPTLFTLTFDIWNNFAQKALKLLELDDVCKIYKSEHHGAEIYINSDDLLDMTIKTFQTLYYNFQMKLKVAKALKALKC